MVEIKVPAKYQEIEKIEKNGIKLTKTELPNTELHETDFSLRHEKVKDRVLSILKGDKYARKNDFYLCLSYWIKTGMINVNVDFQEWNKITKPESISRCRRELMSLAKKGNKDYAFLLKDEETIDIREKEKENYINYYKKFVIKK